MGEKDEKDEKNPTMRENRRFRGLFVGAGTIPIVPGLRRALAMDGGADLRRLNAGTHPVLLNHEGDYLMQVGRIVSAKVAKRGVEGEVEIFGTAPEEVHNALDNGAANLSIGFRPLKNEYIDVEDEGMLIRSIMWEADEVSLVAVGASRDARLEEEEIDGKWKAIGA